MPLLAGAAMASDEVGGNMRNFRETPPTAAPGADSLERAGLEAAGNLFPLSLAKKAGQKSASPNIKSGGIVFGYAQSFGSSGTLVDFYNWEALTHIATPFVSFDASGNLTGTSNFTGRDSNLKAGGAAQAAGVKVILTMLNSFDNTVTNTVFASPTGRATLINNIKNLLVADTYSHGVTFDLEPFSWNAAATTGMGIFFQDLRTALNAAGLPNSEISIYVDPNSSSSKWNMAESGPYLDYLLYSAYDYATGDTPHAITDYNSGQNGVDFFFDDDGTVALDDGIDPTKLVYVISSYARTWPGTTTYNVAGTPGASFSMGFTDAMYDTTLNPTHSGPYTSNYMNGDEAGWYTYNNGTNDRVVTWDSPPAMAMKYGTAVSYAGSGIYAGRKLGGVGWWSLMWTEETTSYDPIASASAGKTRAYQQPYQLAQEMFATPGKTDFLVTGFEGLNFRWRDPNESPDTTALSTTARAIVTSPAGAGRPASTTNALALTVNTTGAQKAFFRYEMLSSNTAPTVMDTNAVIAQVDSTTQFTTYIYTPSAYANATIRMVVMDANRQLEQGPAVSLNASGWRTIAFDLTDSANVTAYTTTEPGFLSGNGVINTAGGGKKDIAFVGWLVQSSSTLSSVITLDEVSYKHVNFGGQNYKINEVRYDGVDGEFVEIQGPPGALPAGFQIRAIDGSGTVGTITPISVSGTIPASGLFVVGDPSVPNVGSTTGFSAAVSDLSDNSPSAIQLYDSVHGGVYDSFAYEAFGGLINLSREGMLGAAREGAPWFGRIAAGVDSTGAKHSAGRYPDGYDTQINGNDFSLMKASPGVANGGSLTASGTTTFDFSAAPTQGFGTFTAFTTAASGVGSSPSGGNVHRCADTSGGGNMTYLGDAALGADGLGYEVTGEVFLPAAGANAQAIALGFCNSGGSTFFSTTRGSSSYENGYWIIYENSASGTLDDGLANHAGSVKFVLASHDNQDGAPVTTIATLGVSGLAGTWTTYDLYIKPVANSLIAKIGGTTIYTGAIPAGGPTSGSIAFGYRDFSGSITSASGTWVDNVVIKPVGIAGVMDWMVY